MGQSRGVDHEETIEIGKGEYYAQKFQGSIGSVATITVHVSDGPKVDVSLTDERGYQDYVEGLTSREYEESPTTAVNQATIRKECSGKKYALVIENNGGSGLLSTFRRKKSVVNLKIDISE